MVFTAHIVAIASAVLALSPSSSPAAQLDRDYFGINTQYLFLRVSPDQWPAHLQGMADSGIRSARFDALWWMAEPRPPVNGRHHYRWDRFDVVASALAQHGIRWYPIIGFSAPWAASVTGQEKSPPKDVNHYAAYAKALAARYGPGGSFWQAHPELPELPVVEWEIWNEPNTGFFWHPAPNPERYAELFEAARSAIKAVDPSARVIVGGLGDAPWFLPRMLAHRPELRNGLDGVGIHPYGDTPEETLALVRQFRDQLDQELRMVDVPLMITEVGWPTDGQGQRRPVPDAQRARYLTEVTERVARSDCGVTRFAPYAWTTPVGDPNRHERWFGFVEADAAPTRTSRAYAEAVGGLRTAFDSGRGTARTEAVCNRRPRLRVSSSSRARLRGRPRRCYRATVTLASQPVANASVSFRYPGRTRRGKRRRPVVKTTNSRGTALACFSGTRGRARGSSRRLSISVTRGDLVHYARATAPLP